MAEIGEQLPSDFGHEPVDRPVVAFLSCGVLPLRRREREIEFDLALAVLRDLGEVRPAANAHRFILVRVVSSAGARGCRGRSGRSRASNARQAPLPKDTRRSLLGSRKGVSRVTRSEPFACPLIWPSIKSGLQPELRRARPRFIPAAA